MQREFKMMIAVTAVAGAMSIGGPMPMGTTMQAVPADGLEPGDSFVVSNADGSECVDGEVTGDTGGIRPGAWEATMEEDGDWAVTIQIPENGPPDAQGNPTPFPAGDYEIHAFCDPVPVVVNSAGVAAPAGEDVGRAYDPITVTIVAPTQDTTPTTATPTTAAPQPAAAPAVVAAPTYTG